MIQFQNLSKAFGDEAVLKGIDLTVERGEIFGLIGRNGAGKTTLLSIVAGLSDATDGACLVGGEIVSGKNRSLKVGYLPDVPAFFDDLSAGEYLDFLFQRKKGYKEKRNQLLHLVGLEEKAVIKTLSRGMRQRLGLAATLVHDPEVLLLDEPSSALDPSGRHELSEILLQLKKEGKTIVLSTHILTDMEKICDRVGFLHDGKIVKTLSPKETEGSGKVRIVFEKDLSPDLFEDLPLTVEKEDEKALIFCGDLQLHQKALLEKLSATGIAILSVNTLGADLDSIFREVEG